MSDTIWVSDAMVAQQNRYSFVPSEAWYADNRQLVKDMMRVYYKAGVLPPELQMPDKSYLKRLYEGNVIDPLPHIMNDTFLWVSQDIRDIFESFDLGRTAFTKVVLYRHDQKTRFEPDYYYLNIAEDKQSVVPRECENIQGFAGGKFHFRLEATPASVAALSRSALDGVDLWMEPRLRGAMFFSDRLYQALKASGLVEDVNFAPRKLVG